MRIILLVSCLINYAQTADAFDRKKITDALIRGTPVEQQVAMQELSSAGPEAPQVLAEAVLATPDRMARTRVATVLEANLKKRKNRTEENLKVLLPLLDSEDPSIVEAISRGVMQYKKHTETKAALKRAVGRARSDQSKVYLLGAFLVSNDGDKAEANYVRGFLADNSEKVRVWSAGYLGTLGGKEGLDICTKVLSRKPEDDATRGLQMRAAIAAGRIQC
jgi:hypothetical protein